MAKMVKSGINPKKDFISKTSYYSKSLPLEKNQSSSGLLIRLTAGLVIFLVFAFVLRYGVFIDKIQSGEMTISSILPTFDGFLNTVANARVLKPTFKIVDIVFGDWGIFNFFRDFLYTIITVFNFLLWLAQNLIACLEYIFYFAKWLFISG